MTYECEYCGKSFDSRMGVSVHKGRSHAEPWTDKTTLEELYIEDNLSTR